MTQRLSFIFDIDDTAYNQLDPFLLAFEKNFAKLANKVSVEELYKQTRHFSDLAFEKTERGEMDIWDMRVYRVTSAFKTFGLKVSKEKALAFEKDYAFFLQHIQLNPAVKEVFKFCKEQGITLGVITNGPAERQQAKIEQLGIRKWIPESHWIISGKVNLMKPDPRIFNYTQAKLKLDPKTTYYIGDSFANDVVGAKAAGWHVIWLNQRHREAESAIKPDVTLTDPERLLSIIKEIVNAL